MLGAHGSDQIHVIVVDGTSLRSTQTFFVILGGVGIAFRAFGLEKI